MNNVKQEILTKDLVIVQKIDKTKILHILIIAIFSIILFITCLNKENYDFTKKILTVLPIIILMVLGLTHIKNDFGERTGIIFSIMVPSIYWCFANYAKIALCNYLVLLMVVLTIYAYRIYLSGISNKNWTIFTFFCIVSVYVSYYELIYVVFINIALFIYFFINTLKQRKYEVKYKKYGKNLKRCEISVVVQMLAYTLIGTLLI